MTNFSFVLEVLLGLFGIFGIAPLIRKKFGQEAGAAATTASGLMMVPAGYEFFKTVSRDLASSRTIQAVSLFTLSAAFLYVVVSIFPVAAAFVDTHKGLGRWTPALIALGAWAYQGSWQKPFGIGFWAVLAIMWVQAIYEDQAINDLVRGRIVTVSNYCTNPLELRLAPLGLFGQSGIAGHWTIAPGKLNTSLDASTDGSRDLVRSHRNAVLFQATSGTSVWGGRPEGGFRHFEIPPNEMGELNLEFCKES